MQMRSLICGGGVILSVATLFAFAGPTTEPSIGKKNVTPSGLTIINNGSGSGVAEAGDSVWVRYTGKLENGTKFDSSDDHAETRKDGINFVLGRHRVIAGWDEGITGMKVGDKRQLIIPPNLGYGAQGAGDSIPPNATLVFDVELMGFKRGGE